MSPSSSQDSCLRNLCAILPNPKTRKLANSGYMSLLLQVLVLVLVFQFLPRPWNKTLGVCQIIMGPCIKITPKAISIFVCLLSIAMVKTMNKNNLGREVIISPHSLQFVMQGSRGRNSRQLPGGRNWNTSWVVKGQVPSSPVLRYSTWSIVLESKQLKRRVEESPSKEVQQSGFR